jgi:hypothetical protein
MNEWEISALTHRKNQFHAIKLKKHAIKFKIHTIKVQKRTIKVQKTRNKSSKNTQTGNTIKTKGLGLV